MMEVEAKFVLPNQKIFKQLQTIDHLAGYMLLPGNVKAVQDQYLDTPDRHLLAAGYACRRRTQPDGMIMTLKGLGGVKGAIHRREELEVYLAADCPVEAWPDSPIRNRVIEIIDGLSLQPLFLLHQTRIVRQVERAGQFVAELSLDDVQLSINDITQTYLELEIEQQPAGGEADLIAMTRYLQEEWQLQPEARSKFERALLLFEAGLLD